MTTKKTSKFFKQGTLIFISWSLLWGAIPGKAEQISLFESKSGWNATMMALISTWTGAPSWDVGQAQQDSFRVTTGFNPSKIEFVVSAPEHDGIKVSSYFQLATSLQGFKTRRVGEQIEIRGASINVSGGFGTFQIGRNFALFASNAIFNDTSSMRGVGYLCVGPDGSGPNCGHIGTGYTWSDWTAGIRYISPDLSGFQIRAGIFDPIETAFGFPGGDALVIGTGDLGGNFDGLFFNFTDIAGTGEIETATPLFELELTYNFKFGDDDANSLLLWAGFLNQSLDDLGVGNGDTDITGTNFGWRLKVGNLGITANAEENEGIAEGFIGFGVRCDNTGCDAVEGDQWYINIDYTVGGTTFGVSFGEGSEDANVLIGNSDVDRELMMAYIQYQLTPNLNINLEIQNFERTTPIGGFAAGVFQPQEEYSAFFLGAEFRY